MDSGDDIWNEKNWVKSCPYTVTNPELLKILRQDAQTAKDMGGMDLRDFIVKSLNMWVNHADNQFVDPEKWKTCASGRSLHDLVQSGYHQCYVGLDLSSGGDMTSISLVFPTDRGFYLWSHSFMPRGRMQEHIATDIAPYDLWEQQNLITVTGGKNDYLTDYKFILSYLHEIRKSQKLEFLGIGIDFYNAAGIVQDLEDFGCPVIAITQSAKSLNTPTTEVQLLIKGGQIEYDRTNELLTWSFVNAALVKDSLDNIKIDKRRVAGRKQESKRIDPVDAVIDAFAVMHLSDHQAAEPVDVSGELDEYLKLMGWI
jgi:phage terminase large subunit-like protein